MLPDDTYREGITSEWLCIYFSADQLNTWLKQNDDHYLTDTYSIGKEDTIDPCLTNPFIPVPTDQVE